MGNAGAGSTRAGQRNYQWQALPGASTETKILSELLRENQEKFSVLRGPQATTAQLLFDYPRPFRSPSIWA